MADGMEAGICYCDYEPWQWWDGRKPRARRAYYCCECGEKIHRGEVYEYVAAKFQGNFFTYKTCLPCSRIRRDYCAPYLMLREVLWDCLGYDYLGEWDEEKADG